MMRTLFGYRRDTAAELHAMRDEIDHLTAQIAASGVALDNAYVQINALHVENARLLQDLAARDTTIAALSAKSARTARKKSTEQSS